MMEADAEAALATDTCSETRTATAIAHANTGKGVKRNIEVTVIGSLLDEEDCYSVLQLTIQLSNGM